MAVYWTEGKDLAIVPDRAFHSGIAQDCIRDNLRLAATHSTYDLSVFQYDGDTEISTSLQQVDTWTLFEDFPPIPILCRSQPFGVENRPVDISVEGKVSAAAVAYMRFYILDHPYPDAAIHTTDPFSGDDNYAGNIFNSTSWTTKSFDDLKPNSGQPLAGPSDAPINLEVAYLVPIISATAAVTVSVRCMRIKETTS